MRFKLGWKGSLGMHKHGTLLSLLLCYVVAQSFIPNTDGLQTLRFQGRRRLRTTSPTTSPTTPTPSTSQPSSEVTSLPVPPPPPPSSNRPTNPLPRSPTATGRRKRIRVRKLRVQKRQGALLLPPEDGEAGAISNNINEGGSRREPLYQEHADEINVPDHYYSPIRRQRMRGNRKLFSQSRGGQLQSVQQYHQSSQESPSASNSNADFRKREKDARRPRYPPPPVVAEENYIQNDDEYTPQQTQPEPKNYAFAYAVRDDGNTDDNNFSHKEARDGKLTMGEYRINLPDGRVQVVRYTAGGDIGYKADVTYEGEGDDHPKKPDLIAKPTPYTAGNQGYLPPSLSPQLPSSSPSPKKYRKKKPKNRQNYGTSPRPTIPSYYNNNEGDFGNFKYGEPPTLSSPRERTISPSLSYDKYEDTHPFYSNGGKGQSQPSSTSRPIYRRPRPRPSSYEIENYPPPTPTGFFSNDPSPSPPPYGRPKSRKNYEKEPFSEHKEYEGNLAFLHDQSPRAGPTIPGNGERRGGRDKNDASSSAIGGYGYPGHPELEHEIETLKKSHKLPRAQQPSLSNPFDQQGFRQRKQQRNNIRLSSKPDSSPADLYNEPGPGNYFTAINGPPSSPSPPPSPPPQKKFFNYPKPVYKNPSTAIPSYNYIDDHEDQQYHHEGLGDDHHHSRNNFETDRRPTPPTFGSYTPISFSGSGKELIPIEDFKAGPARKNFKTNSAKKPIRHQKYRKPPTQVVDHYYDEPTPARAGPSTKPKLQKEPESVAYKEPYLYYNSQHPSYHHGGYIPPTKAPGRFRQQLPSASPSPATSYTIDFPGGQHSFYLKTGPGSSGLHTKSSPTSPTPFNVNVKHPQQFHHETQSPYRSPSPTSPTPRKKPSGNGSGLVFFETPGTGPRPTQGVKHLLSQLPNISGGSPTPDSFPNTVIHPYEVGAKDYGHSVGYKNSFNTPSSGEAHEHEDGHHTTKTEHGNTENENELNNARDRDYLFDNGQEVVVASPEFESHRFRPSPSPTPAEQFHYRKSLSQSPRPRTISSSLSNPGSTPESFQDVDYQQNYQLLQPVSPTPAISSSHFHQPIHDYSNSDLGIDPRHVSPLGFSTISEDAYLNSGDGTAHQKQQPDLNFQYQYEEGGGVVK